jgi:NAD(P)-dependent dehydrogenase (short-subunit alcohol dehydrogenase family)
MSTDKPVVIITGTSSGIGFETSLEFARNGYQVFATMRDISKKLELDVAAKSENLHLDFVDIDVDNEVSVKNGIQQILSITNRIDILVNNAGYGLIGSIEDSSIEEIKSQLETDFFGPIRMIKAVLPIMRKQQSGKIINVSSIAGQIGFALTSGYVASKYALEGLTDSLRQELAPYGISLSLIEPGVVKSNFHKNMKIAQKARENSMYKEMTELMMKQVALLFERGLSTKIVAKKIVEVTKIPVMGPRYIVGEDAELLLENKKRMNGLEFEKYVQEVFKDVLSFTD